MRIIGDDREKIEKRVTCRNCGKIIGFLPIDVRERTTRDISDCYDIERTIKCPNCSKEINV